MSGVEERLQYLEQTKANIRTSINALDGDLTENSPLDEYINSIQHIVDTTIISQGELDTLVNSIKSINGEENINV